MTAILKGRKAPRAALGVRAHSGWAAAILLAGPVKRPVVVERRRIELCEPALARQPFHEAEPMPFDAARAYIARCAAASEKHARAAIAGLSGFAAARGYGLNACGVVTASGRALPELAKILASHSLIHAAEGEFYRDAVARACERDHIAVMRVKERELADWLGARVPDFKDRIAEFGKELGAPWTADQKLATMVAWLVLASG